MAVTFHGSVREGLMPRGRPRKSIKQLKLSGRWAAMPLDEKFKRFREDALTDDQRDRLLAVMKAEIERRGVRLNPDDELLRPLIESEGDATERILTGLEDSLRSAPATSPAITTDATVPGA